MREIKSELTYCDRQHVTASLLVHSSHFLYLFFRQKSVSQSEHHATKTNKKLERNTNKRVHPTVQSLQTQSRKARLGSRETQQTGVRQKAIPAQSNSQAISPEEFGWIRGQQRQRQGYSRLPTSIKWVVGGVGKAWHSSGCVCVSCFVLYRMSWWWIFSNLFFLCCFYCL